MGPYVYTYRPARVRAERRFFRARLLLLVAAPVLLSVALSSPVSADTRQGVSSSGCVVRHTLWSGSAVGVRTAKVAFKAVLNADPTVLYGQWVLSAGGTSSGYWWSSRSGYSSTVIWAGPNGSYTPTANVGPGTGGTLSYVVTVPGYAPTSCATISDVRIDLTFYTAGETAPPGGGGMVPTPTPAGPTPTPPTMPTPVPGAPTPGPGVWCDPATLYSVSGQTCYPAPPAGFCYWSTADGPTLVPCESPPPSPTPGPTADLTTCAGLQATYGYEFCFSGGPVGGQFGNTGTIGTVTGWDGGEPVAVGGWVTIQHTGAGAASAWSINANGGCTFNGTGWTTENYNVNRGTGSGAIGTYHVNLNGAVGTRNPLTTENWTVDAAASRNWGSPCTNSSTNQSVPMKINKSGGTGAITWTWVIFFDMGNSPGTTPPPTPTPSPFAPTTPPNYWGPGGATPPPIDLDIDLDVDICADNPNISACQPFPSFLVDICAGNPGIAACATAPPAAPTFGSPEPASTWLADRMGGLGDALSAKAPFGYIDQVGDEFTAAIDGAEGAALDLTFDMPWFAPAEAGGTRTEALELPLATYAAQLAEWRWIGVALLMLAAGRFFIAIALRAVGSGKVRDGDDA